MEIVVANFHSAFINNIFFWQPIYSQKTERELLLGQYGYSSYLS